MLKPSIEQLQALEHFINQVHPLSPSEWNQFASIWQTVTVKRKEILRIPGETERYLYFVIEGIQRAYHLDESGNEQTIVFTYPHSFSGIADSFLTQTPSRYTLEALTPGVLLKTSHERLFSLMGKVRSVERLILTMTAFALKGVIERQVELASFSAEKKFTTLLHRSPHLLQLIPHKYLASYLGIDATTFSKLMGKVRL